MAHYITTLISIAARESIKASSFVLTGGGTLVLAAIWPALGVTVEETGLMGGLVALSAKLILALTVTFLVRLTLAPMTLHRRNNPIKISCGVGEPYIKTETLPNRTSVIKARIKVKNRGSECLNDLSGKILDFSPPVHGVAPGASLPIALSDQHTLGPGDERFITVAYWTASYGGALAGDPVLRFPGHSGGYDGSMPNILLPTEKAPALITIECGAGSACYPARAVIKLWSTADRQLAMSFG